MKRRCGARVLVMRNTRSTVLLERRGVKVRGCAFCDHFTELPFTSELRFTRRKTGQPNYPSTNQRITVPECSVFAVLGGDRHITRRQFCRGPDPGHRCQLGDYVLGGLGHCGARRPACRRLALAGLLAILAPNLWAGTFVTFGPARYVRDKGKPGPVTQTFSILDPNTTYTLQIDSTGVSSAVIRLNGAFLGKAILSTGCDSPRP